MMPENLETAQKMFSMAQEKRSVAKELHAAGHFNDAVSRSYYSVFHLIGLAMFLNGKSFSSHSQLIGSFNKDLVATGMVIRDAGKAINRLFELRQSADYDFYERSSLEESSQALKDLDLVFTAVSDYVKITFSIELT